MKTKTLFLSIAATASVFSAAASLRSVTPTAWNGDPKCWQMQRHHQKMAAVTNGGSRVVFIGDSITHFWETNGKTQWERYFAGEPYKALNLGTSGDRTEHVLWRLTEGKELDGYEAKVILLMIGTNNTGHFPFERETPIDTIEGVRKILKVIAEKQPNARIILQPIFPRGGTADDACRRRNDTVNKILQKSCDGKRVIWCDFSDKFLDAEGRLSLDIFPDHLHPNWRGYEMWAGAVIPLIDKCLAAKPGEAIPGVWASSPGCYRPIDDQIHGDDGYWVVWWERGLLAEQRARIVDNGTKEFDIVMLGDSITHRWYREGGEGRELYAEITNRYNVLNLGIGGDRSRHLLWRLENGELEGYKTKTFTLMIGTNDRATRPHEIDGVVKTVGRILELLAKKHPEATTVLMPIFPRNAKSDDNLRKGNAAISVKLKAFADGKKVRWLDFNDKFLTADGELTKEVMNDLLHPNEKGYRIWLDAIAPVWKELLGK